MQQHGGNAAMALGDLAVNRIPLLPYWSVASISIFTSFYSVWSTVHFYLFGTFLYPFLEAHRPYAWIAYLGLFLSHWAVFLLFAAIMKVKQAVVDGKVPWSREGLGKGARGRTPRKVR